MELFCLDWDDYMGVDICQNSLPILIEAHFVVQK
jgi:hypothetical protein